MLPWTTKLIYGIVSDTIPIFGSRKKAWLIIMGLVQLITLSIAASAIVYDPVTMVVIMTMNSVAGAFMDVIVDALSVMQAKRDPKMGTQELQSFSWTLNGVASIFGGFSGAYLTGYVNPYWCFGIYAFAGVLVVLSTLNMNKSLEVEGDFEAEELVGEDTSRSGIRIRRRFC